jgi:bleomycin hydrolase
MICKGLSVILFLIWNNNSKPIIMKTKTFILSFFFLLPSLVYCNNDKTQILQGSWMGNVTTNQFSLRALLRFEVTKDNIKGFLDSPDQGLKDLVMDKVWTTQDSVFVDASKSLNAGIIFKGRFLPGDSVIDGVWAGALSLRLRRTNYVFTLKTNFNPEIEGYKIIKLIKSSPIKDQQATSLCWSFATTSFIETEAIRLGKCPLILSPMFFVTPTYIDKAEKYIRMNGKSYFGPGDLTISIMRAYKNYGAIPQIVYTGKKDSISRYDHSEMDNALLEKVKYYVKSGRGKMTTEGYRKDINDILSGTLGKAPDTFTYNQKLYTPKSFAKEVVGINPDDYVEITSFSHHPFYSKFILEIQANWNNNYYLNLPINDFSNLVDYAVSHNYSICWDGDIYEGYNNGFAVLSDDTKIITQQIRQEAFDNQTTKDVHNMHIIGIAENDKRNRFYILKNSSDAKNCGGYLYMSKEYLLLKTISIMVNKGGIPKVIKDKFTSVL